jgi:hypothetical protein
VTEAPSRLGPGEWDMRVLWLEPDRLIPNQANPNVQDDATFNALVESIRTEGWTQPVLAVAVSDIVAETPYRIVGGEHRWRAARVLGCRVPVLPLRAEEFDQDRQNWNLVKDNLLRGRLNPEKFAALYEEMVGKYDAEVLQSLMGFTDQDAFRKMYKETRDALPPELAKALDEAKDEIRTIDDLSTVLNRLFREFGDTLDSDFMVFTWAGKDVFWVRCSPLLFAEMKAWGELADAEGSSLSQQLEQVILHRRSLSVDGAAMA